MYYAIICIYVIAYFKYDIKLRLADEISFPPRFNKI